MPENEECGCKPEVEEGATIPETEERVYMPEMDESACMPEIDACVCISAADAQMCVLEMDERVCVCETQECGCKPETDERACMTGTNEPVYRSETEERGCEREQKAEICLGLSGIDADFLRHMSGYIGATVTIYTAGGGESGCGMTGVLIQCGDSFVRLLTQPASAPERPQGLCRTCPFYAVCSARKTQKPQCISVGAMVDIPVARITTFVHSAVCGDNGYST